MPFLKNENLIYVHCAKTGGSSIEKAFGMTEKENFFSLSPAGNVYPKYKSLLRETDLNIYCTRTPQHLPASILYKIFPDFYEKSFSFTVFREPISRLESEYFHVKTTQNPRQCDFWKMNFNDFIKNSLNLPPMVRNTIFDGHLETQSSMIKMNDEVIVNKIYKFTEIENVFKDFNKPLFHERKGNYNEITMKKSTIGLINDFYSEDFSFYSKL